MVIIAPILALLSRMAGKLLNTIFGWATMTLFGRVPQSRQIFLSIIALGSVLWLAVVLGIAFPDFGTFLLGFVPLPNWVEEAWVRIAMLGAAVLIPIVVGVISANAGAWGASSGYPLQGKGRTQGLSLHFRSGPHPGADDDFGSLRKIAGNHEAMEQPAHASAGGGR
jgi:hypothetical protein